MRETERLNDKLTDMWGSGMTAEEIGSQLGLSANAVYKRRQRLMLGRHRGGYRSFIEDPDTRRWFIRNYPYLSNVTISTFLGVSADHIRKTAIRLGLRKSKEYVSDAKSSAAVGRTRGSDGKFIKQTEI